MNIVMKMRDTMLINEQDIQLLMQLLQLNTVTPMETGKICQIEEAQILFQDYAKQIGFDTILFASPTHNVMNTQFTPLSVFEKINEMGNDFYSCQPNCVLQFGKSNNAKRTLLFNVHMDTVSGDVNVIHKDNKIYGRGIVDAKGLGIAVLAGIRQAIQQDPLLKEKITIIIQSVVGEEGGAMGVYGTRHLVELGYIGQLNIVCEPTQLGIFDRTTSSMTMRIDINGTGSTDDAPCDGHNATIILASLADYLTKNLSQKIINAGGKMCIAGINTGKMHNRIYGTGQLLINFAYHSLELAQQIEQWFEKTFNEWQQKFEKNYMLYDVAKKTALDLGKICGKTWLKRNLPVLNNRHQALEQMFNNINIIRHDEHSNLKPFTCDAMWLQQSGCYTVILGPGDLSLNNAHAEDEYIDVADYNKYAEQIAQIVRAFAIYSEEQTRIQQEDRSWTIQNIPC